MVWRRREIEREFCAEITRNTNVEMTSRNKGCLMAFREEDYSNDFY